MIFNLNTTTLINDLEAMITVADIEKIFECVSVFPACTFGIGALVLVCVLYWLFCVPCNWIKQLDDVSYELALGSKPKINATGKKDAINRIRKLRKLETGELPPPFPNGWYCLMESSVLKVGKVKSVSCLGEQFAVYRTLQNKVYALDAYCPHMGANMGVGGRVVGDNLECPFHQWSFRGSDGKCIDIPYTSCAPHGSKVRTWICRESMDNIFIWYHVDGNEEPWDLPVVNEIETKEFIYQGRNEFYINCHIQEIPENGADNAHFAVVHNASLLAGGGDHFNSILANAGSHRWDSTWKASEKTKHMASITLNHSIELTKNFHVLNMDLTGNQIGPGYVQLHFTSAVGRIKVIQTLTPIEPFVQKVVHRFYAPRIMAPIMKFVVFGESIMFERDIDVWNHKIYRSKPQLVKEDATIKSFRSWYAQFYSENSKSFAEACGNLEW